MKKFKNIKLMLLGLLCLGSMNAFADGELTNGTLKFTIGGDGKAIITGFASGQASADLVIPNKIKNLADNKEYTVGGIDENAFNKEKNIETIDIQADGVTTITEKMFSGLNKLTTIKLGSKVTAIDAGAFAGTKIASLDLSKTSVEKINNLFGSNLEYNTGVVYYTAHETYEANVALMGDKARTTSTVKTKGVFDDKSAADYNAKLDGAIKEGDPLKYTEGTANTFNKTTYGKTYTWIKVAGDQKVYTTKSAAAYNATLPAALQAGEELTDKTARLYNDWINTFNATQIEYAYYNYLSLLNGARPLDEKLAADEKFTSSGEAYDYTKALYGNKTGKDGKGFTKSATYSPEEAAAWNAANPDKTPVVAGDAKPAAETTFDATTAAAWNDAHPDETPVAAGDLKPGYAASLLAANDANYATFGPGAARNGDVKVFKAAADQRNFNASLNENAYKGIVVADQTNPVTKQFISEILYKKEHDVLSNADALAYNATLTGAVKKDDVILDAEGNPETMDDHDAYVYNQEMAIENGIGTFAAAGNYTGATATAATAAEYNASLEGAVTAGKDNPAANVYYTEAECNTYNETELVKAGKTPVYDETTLNPTVKIKAGKVAKKEYTVLTEVSLPATKWQVISAAQPTTTADRYVGAFEGCSNLATVNFGGNDGKTTQVIEDYAFLGTKVEAIDLSKTKVAALPATLVVDQDVVTVNESLKSVTLNTEIAAIPASIFENCSALATFTFASDEAFEAAEITSYPLTIGKKAFANTALKSFTLPVVTSTATKSTIKASAFSGCSNLKEFTFLTDAKKPKLIVDAEAFPGCKDVKFYTTNTYVAAADGVAPKNSYFVIGSPTDYETPFYPVEYANNPGKYYIKYHAIQNIAVKKDEAKVYNAYLDDVNFTLNMCLYKASGGYYNVKAGDDVLIITYNKDLEYETGSGNGSMLGSTPNALKIVLDKDGVTLGELDKAAGVDKVVYGWVNSKKAGTGWQHITTAKGGVFAAGTMYILAAEPEEDGRLTVNWLDEDGNIEEQTTGIQSVINAEPIQDNEIYNLQGIRVNKAQKGMFIKNGKKYVVK